MELEEKYQEIDEIRAFIKRRMEHHAEIPSFDRSGGWHEAEYQFRSMLLQCSIAESLSGVNIRSVMNRLETLERMFSPLAQEDHADQAMTFQERLAGIEYALERLEQRMNTLERRYIAYG